MSKKHFLNPIKVYSSVNIEKFIYQILYTLYTNFTKYAQNISMKNVF